MLENIELDIERMVLDPNNPRFIKDLRHHERIRNDQIREYQEKTLARFGTQETNDEDDVTNIKDLYDSMITIGYVPIDRVVVKKLE